MNGSSSAACEERVTEVRLRDGEFWKVETLPKGVPARLDKALEQR
jgi:hypothetical protein